MGQSVSHGGHPLSNTISKVQVVKVWRERNYATCRHIIIHENCTDFSSDLETPMLYRPEVLWCTFLSEGHWEGILERCRGHVVAR